MLPKPPDSRGRLKGLGIVVSIAIAAVAVSVLTHTLGNIDYDQVIEVIRHTSSGLIALAAMLVVTSYLSLTLYDLLALRTIAGPVGNLRRLPLLRKMLKDNGGPTAATTCSRRSIRLSHSVSTVSGIAAPWFSSAAAGNAGTRSKQAISMD